MEVDPRQGDLFLTLIQGGKKDDDSPMFKLRDSTDTGVCEPADKDSDKQN